MNALADLARRLVDKTAAPDRVLPPPAALADCIATLRQRLRDGGDVAVPADQQAAALQRFWVRREFDDLHTARLVCFGLALPLGAQGQSLLDNAARFTALLRCVDAWRDQPRRFRRLYQGLLHGYFSLDPTAPGTAPATAAHWQQLRAYLDDRARHLADPRHDPEWVQLVATHRHLFTDQPGAPHAKALLSGDRAALDTLCERLNIPAGSWFMRELVSAQLSAVVATDDDGFLAGLLPALTALAGHPPLQDRGLLALLNRRARLPTGSPPHIGLLQASLQRWGEPDATSPDARWRAVDPAVQALFTRDLAWARIELFFRHWGGDTAAQRRRAAFWQRYLPAIGRLRLALDPRARPPANPTLGAELVPFVVSGTQPPQAPTLLMTLGAVTLAESSPPDTPLRAYTADTGPLDASPPLLQWTHDDGLQGWPTWEARFEAGLQQRFELLPGAAAPGQLVNHLDLSDALDLGEPTPPIAAPPPMAARPAAASAGADAQWRTAEAAHLPYSRADLAVFARAHGFQVDDRSAQGAGLWVLAPKADANVRHVLGRWGFSEVPGTGWRK